MGFLDGDRYDSLAAQLGATVVRDRDRPALQKNGVVVNFQEVFGDSWGNLGASYFRFRAELPPPGVPKFRLYPEGFQSFMSKLFGGQDVELGHRSIDLKFMVKAVSPSVVKELWKPEVCDRLDAMGDVSIEGHDRRIDLDHPFETNLLMDPVPGLELLFALGDVDLYGRDVLRALPDAQFRPELGEVWLPGPGNVRVGFSRSEEDVMFRGQIDADLGFELTDAIRAQFKLGRMTVDRNDAKWFIFWFTKSPEQLLLDIERMRQLAAGGPADGIFR